MNDCIKFTVISKVISTIDRNKDEHSKDYLLRLQIIAKELSDQYDKMRKNYLIPHSLRILNSNTDPNNARL